MDDQKIAWINLETIVAAARVLQDAVNARVALQDEAERLNLL